MSAHFLSSVDLPAVRKRLETEGSFLVENAYDPVFCRAAIDFIDHCPPGAKTESGYDNTELRIWDSQSLNPLFASFFEKSQASLELLLGECPQPKTLLAIRNRAVDTSRDDLQLGRWHIDSFFKQMKVFLFLTDTSEETGPFEFIPQTHRGPFKCRMLVAGSYFRPRDFLSGGQRTYQKIAEQRIRKLQDYGYQPKPVVCKAGTLMFVNTSAIHRARPCVSGSRYALTAYFK